MNRRKRAVELFSDFLRSMSRALGCRPCNSQYLQRLPLYRTIQAGTHIQSRSAQICVSMSLCPEQGPNQWTKLILIVLGTQSYNCTWPICDRRVMMRQISAHVCPVNYTSRSHTRWQQRSECQGYHPCPPWMGIEKSAGPGNTRFPPESLAEKTPLLFCLFCLLQFYWMALKGEASTQSLLQMPFPLISVVVSIYEISKT